MPQIAADFIGGWVVKGTVKIMSPRKGEVEKIKIISPRAYGSKAAADEFRELAVKQGIKDAFVTDKADDPD